MARFGVDVALAESASLRREVLHQLRTLFWNLAYCQAQVSSLEALEAQTAALVENVRRRVAQGEVRPIEATRVDIELQKLRSEVATARTSLGARQAALALWLDVGTGAPVVAVARLDEALPTLPRELAVARARRTHPTLALARAKSRQLEAEVTAARQARIPAVSLTGFASHELDRRAYGVGFTVDVPLWNWNSGPIAEAESQRAASEKLAEASLLELETSVIDAQATCQAAADAAAQLRNNVLPQAETAAATMEKTYQLGEASLLEVIDARRTLLDTRRLYLGALAQAQIACSYLNVLVGEKTQ